MYTISEFAEKIGVSVHTLQRWDREGRLIAKRTHTNRRYYTDADLDYVLGGASHISQSSHRVVVYCRVSSPSQKPDLVNQRHLLELFCAGRGLEVDEWIEEIGGGLNFKRKKLLELINDILSGKVKTLVVAHKDRLTRFGFDLIEYICQQNNCEILVMNSLSVSPEQEMVEDLMTIIHSFSSRLYGLRNYRKSLEKALNDDKSTSDTPQSNT